MNQDNYIAVARPQWSSGILVARQIAQRKLGMHRTRCNCQKQKQNSPARKTMSFHNEFIAHNHRAFSGLNLEPHADLRLSPQIQPRFASLANRKMKFSLMESLGVTLIVKPGCEVATARLKCHAGVQNGVRSAGRRSSIVV